MWDVHLDWVDIMKKKVKDAEGADWQMQSNTGLSTAIFHSCPQFKLGSNQWSWLLNFSKLMKIPAKLCKSWWKKCFLTFFGSGKSNFSEYLGLKINAIDFSKCQLNRLKCEKRWWKEKLLSRSKIKKEAKLKKKLKTNKHGILMFFLCCRLSIPAVWNNFKILCSGASLISTILIQVKTPPD